MGHGRSGSRFYLLLCRISFIDCGKKVDSIDSKVEGLDSKVVGIEGIMAKMSGRVGISEQAVSAHDKRFDQFEE